jgi:hypothetical protein
LLIHRDGPIKATLLLQHNAQIVVHLGVGWPARECLAKSRYCFIVFSKRLERCASVRVRLSVVGPERECSPIGSDRIMQLALLLQNRGGSGNSDSPLGGFPA